MFPTNRGDHLIALRTRAAVTLTYSFGRTVGDSISSRALIASRQQGLLIVDAKFPDGSWHTRHSESY
jgi:hypothetical protein